MTDDDAATTTTTNDSVTSDPRTDPQPDADERTTLTEFLDWYRLALVLKASGITDEQGRARHVPSKTTLVGLVRHCAEVERHWFRRRFAGDAVEGLYGPEAGYQAGEEPDFDLIADASLADAWPTTSGSARRRAGSSRALRASTRPPPSAHRRTGDAP